MADGSITFDEGLGLKALDPNESRRKQRGMGDPGGFEISSPKSAKLSSPSKLMAEGLGGKVIDSNEIRRKQKGIHEPISPLNSTRISSVHASPNGFGAHSPKSAKASNSARKLQQVFFEESLRVETEARMLEIVGHLEDELNNSEDPFILDVVTAKLQNIQQSWREAEKQTPPPMAEGTISMEEGPGLIAIDSNEIRRKQKSISDPNSYVRLQQSTSTTHIAGFGSYRHKSSISPNSSPTVTKSFISTEVDLSSRLSSGLSSPPNGFGAHSPKSAKNMTSARKLQQAFFEEGLRVEAEDAMKGSATPSSSNGVGAISPKSHGHTTDAQEMQQASFKEGLVREAEARARVTHLHGNTYQFQRTPSEVRNSNSNTKILNNQSGAVPKPLNHASTSTNPVSQPKAMNRQVQTNKNWTSLFRSQGPSSNMKLDFYPELKKGKNAVVELDITHLDENCWSHCLVGHFLDARKDFRLASSTAHKQWGKMTKYGLLSVKSDNAGFLYFEFKDEACQLAVLEGGPWFFSQKFLVLKKWRRMMTPSKISPSSIPTWVKLHNLPPECWTEEGLSRVASAIGQPKHVDQATKKKTRLAYARVCVEIEAADELPDDIQVTVDGESVSVRVEYQLMPPVCSECKVFGHATTGCPRTIPHKQTRDSGVPKSDWQTVIKGSIVSNVGGSEALEAATVSVVAVVDTSMPKVTEDDIAGSESEGEELNVSTDTPDQVIVDTGVLIGSVEAGSINSVPDSVGVPSQSVPLVKPVPPDDKAETGKGEASFQSSKGFKAHNNKGNGKNNSKKWSNSSKKRNK
ncbi:hypothetical protein RHGRI_020851 [Rhododendron griersonianum]|uniref:DUF4283 domain-containing protein n=1 Tax=Rhododendron griersonianum TaxID=479676 RepID=A0AAV6JL88_9ERIC|nr:hypothetical protein RHGRI_020851 [Rhododendron griersonianum]